MSSIILTSNDEGVRQDRYFIKDNRNKNTCTKTKSDLKMFYEWALSNGEMRMIEDIILNQTDFHITGYPIVNLFSSTVLA
jgi:carbon starvation protein CstA